MGNRRDGSLSYSSSPSIFLQLSAMHFLPRLSATSSLLLSRAGEGAVGLQEPSMSISSGIREGLGMAPLLPLCMTAPMALSSHSTCQPLTQASSQHAPLPSVRAAAGGALPKWLAAGKELTPEEPAPDVHSCVHAAAVPASCCARLPMEEHRAGLLGRCHLHACGGVMGTELLCPSPRFALLGADYIQAVGLQYFLWQRSLRPNLTLTSLLFV